MCEGYWSEDSSTPCRINLIVKDVNCNRIAYLQPFYVLNPHEKWNYLTELDAAWHTENFDTLNVEIDQKIRKLFKFLVGYPYKNAKSLIAKPLKLTAKPPTAKPLNRETSAHRPYNTDI